MGSEIRPTDHFESPDLSTAAFSRRKGIDLDVVYCLGNEAMPGYFKIGFTTRTAAARANDLYSGYGDDYTTGVPAPFNVVREWELPGGRGEHVEKAVHRVLGHRRPNPRREFFRFDDAAHAVAEIERALHELDWYSTAIAEVEQKQLEAQLRIARRKAADDAERRADEHAREVAARVERAMQVAAEAATSNACHRHGLAWAGGVALVLGGFGAVSGARDSFFVLVALASIAAYFWNRATPLSRYLASDEYSRQVTEVKAQAMMAATSSSSEGEALPTVSAPPQSQDALNELRSPRLADGFAAEVTAHPSANRTAVAARCPSCACLHRISATAGSYVKVYCERCGNVFEAMTKASDEIPAVVAKRAYLVADKSNSPHRMAREADGRSTISEGRVTARHVQPSTPARLTLPPLAPQPEPKPRSAAVGPTATDKPEGPCHSANGAARVLDAASPLAVAECANCGCLHTIDARPGELVQVVCEGCNFSMRVTAAALTLGSAPMR